MARPVDPTLRHRVLAAATREFAERGYAGASMAEIGRQARVTKGGVYFHFQRKEDLFFAVLDTERARLRDALEPTARVAVRHGGAAGLRAFLAEYLRFHFRAPHAARVMRVLASELRARFTAQVREDVRSAQRALRARIRELLMVGAGDGSLFASDPAQAAFLLAGAVEGVLDQWLAAPRDAEAFCEADALADALVAPHATGAAAAIRIAGDAEADNEHYRPPF